MNRITALYMRCSTDHQTVESQMHSLKEYCSRSKITNYEMFIDEGISGAVENRPSLNRLMAMVENGEIEQIIVFSFSRFARSTSHLLKALQKCKEKNTRFHSVTEAIDTNSPMGMALFTILGALSQLERELIRERVKAGLANAKAKGKIIGRKKLRDSDLIRKLLKSGLTFRACAAIAKCSHGSIHAEKMAMKREEEELRKKMEDENLLSPQPMPPEPPPTPGRPSLRLV